MPLFLHKPLTQENGTQTVYRSEFFGLLFDDGEGVDDVILANSLPHSYDLLTMIGVALEDMGCPDGNTPENVAHVEMRVSVLINDNIHDVAVQNQWLPIVTDVTDESAVLRMLEHFIQLDFEQSSPTVSTAQEKEAIIDAFKEQHGESVDGGNVSIIFEITPHKK